MGKTKDLGHLAHIVTYDSSNNITLPANLTVNGTITGYATTASLSTYATQSYVSTQISNLVASAPATLDTLNELATALGNDPNFATTIATSIGTKVPSTRTITINGTAYDLSADRSWNITSMIYPAAGIPLSTGTAWGTSITNNSANWNTAYGWGNHATAGYLTGITSTQVTTALGFTPVANTRTITINGTTYDLSADRSWTITASGGVTSFNTRTGAITLSSSDVTGALGYTPYNNTNPSSYITSSGTAAAINQTVGAGSEANLVYSQIADNDFFRIRVGGASNAGWVEIATADDGTEPIYVRQYTGVFSSLTRTATLLDGSGNTSFPGTVSSPTFRLSNSSNNAYFTGNSDWGVRLVNDNGYIQFGPANTSWTHIYSDKNFYFNQNLYVNGTQVVTNSGTWSISVSGNSTTTSQRDFNYLRVNSNDDLYLDYNHGQSIVGVYSSYRYQGVFSMGNAYKLPKDGTSTGNLYGLAWSHPNAGGVASNLNDHGLLVLINGGFAASVSSSIRAASDMRAPIFYDQNDTGYYADFNSTSDSAIRVRGGMLMGPNPTWGAYLQVGGNGRNTSYATVTATNGNLHLDCGNGYEMYLNYYSGNQIRAHSTLYMVGNPVTGVGSISLNNGFTISQGGSNYASFNSWTFLSGYHGFYSSYGGGAHIFPNNGSYGSWGINGQINSWQGFEFKSGQDLVNLMVHTNSNDSGFYNQRAGWQFRWSGGQMYIYKNSYGGGTEAVALDSSNWSSYVNGSDERRKENIRPISDAISKIKQLNGVTYNWISDLSGKREIGLLAQAVEKIVPEAVHYDEMQDMYSVKYGNLNALIIEAVKEHEDRIQKQDEIIKDLQLKLSNFTK